MKFFKRQLSFQRITSSGNFIPELDGLRFIAIASVVLYHLRGFILVKDNHAYTDRFDYSILLNYLSHARLGVPLFFVISGFILGLPFANWHLLKEGPVKLKNYFFRRLTRLEPPYIIVMTLLFFGFVFIDKKFSLDEGLGSYLASLTYSHNIIYNVSPKLNGVAWSLEVEIQFYLLAPLLAYLFSIKNVKVRRLILVGIILGSLGFNQFHFNPFPFISLINCLHYFILGFLLVDLYVSKTYFIPKTKYDKIIGLIFFLLIWLYDAKDFEGYAVRYGWRIVQLASIFFFYYYVLFNQTYRFFSFKWITGIGGMCYSIYLLHSPIIGLIGNPLMKFQFSDFSFINIPIFTAILIGAILCVSAAFYLLIERPCMDQNWPRKLLKMHKTKVLPIVLMALLLASTANAQSNKLQLGIQACPSLISLHGNEMVNQATQTGLGFSAGITAEFRLTQKFTLQTSLGVDRKGALSKGFVSDTLGNTIGDYKNHVQFDYIVLPVLLRYHFGKQQQFFVNAGPYLGYLFRQNNKVKSDLFQDYSYSDQAYFKQLDAGVTAGIGMNIPLNEELVLSVECRDNLGISNISKLPVVDGGKNQTNSINFLVGLHYQLGN
ncbi:MAG: hypothetical protein RLZZ65_17 [Bacteroidota bacterium]|jgi:peptidoglycan/LPS O-acetylase OafA/YrhL